MYKLEKCSPECNLYDNKIEYQYQSCIYLHKYYYDRTKKLRLQDREVFNNTDLYKYHTAKKGIRINTSYCYKNYKRKTIDKRYNPNIMNV